MECFALFDSNVELSLEQPYVLLGYDIRPDLYVDLDQAKSHSKILNKKVAHIELDEADVLDCVNSMWDRMSRSLNCRVLEIYKSE